MFLKSSFCFVEVRLMTVSPLEIVIPFKTPFERGFTIETARIIWEEHLSKNLPIRINKRLVANDKYELVVVDGQRRVRAAIMLQIPQIEVEVWSDEDIKLAS
jgi:hypothetical protein